MFGIKLPFEEYKKQETDFVSETLDKIERGIPFEERNKDFILRQCEDSM